MKLFKNFIITTIICGLVNLLFYLMLKFQVYVYPNGLLAKLDTNNFDWYSIEIFGTMLVFTGCNYLWDELYQAFKIK